ASIGLSGNSSPQLYRPGAKTTPTMLLPLENTETIKMVNESLRVDANEIRSGDPLIDKIMRAHLNRRVSQTSPMDDLPPGIARLSDSSPAYEREFAEKVKQQLLSKRTPLTAPSPGIR
ncbi:MAG: hypothetical protein SGPRY_014702, partial [Prymnesium sp.]